jgi:hypothetical protein
MGGVTGWKHHLDDKQSAMGIHRTTTVTEYGSIPTFYQLSTRWAGVIDWPSSRTSMTIFWLRPRLAGGST